MNRNDMLVLHITNDYKVSVETMENGVSSVKYISAESILDCLKSSIHNDGRIDSGILPKIVYHTAAVRTEMNSL